MKNALLVIDVQKIYTHSESELHCDDSAATVERINRLIDSFSGRNEPVIYIRHMHKRNGSDLGRMFDFTGEAEEDFNFKEGESEVEYDPRLILIGSALEIVKNRYSAFEGTELDKRLKKLKANTVTICGFMTNFCCESTARAAHDKDYYVDFVADATGTPGTDSMNEKKIRKIVSELLEAGFARIKTTKEVLRQA